MATSKPDPLAIVSQIPTDETDETKPKPPWAQPRLTNPPDHDNPQGYPELTQAQLDEIPY